MCTIMTFDYATFTAHSETIVKQIESDAVRNSHGYALILSNFDPSKAIIIQTLDLSTILSALAVFPFERFWLHSRYSTSSTKGLAGCHAFTPHNGEYVMHNGVLQHKGTRELPVDSMAISELLKFMGPKQVAQYLAMNEPYANVFIVNPEKGTWVVSRSQKGTLFWDGNANFSSSPIPVLCDSPFPLENFAECFHTIQEPPKPVWPAYVHDSIPYSAPMWSEPYAREDTEVYSWATETIESILTAEKDGLLLLPDWYDIFCDKGWDTTNIPKRILDNVPEKVKTELLRLKESFGSKVIDVKKGKEKCSSKKPIKN